jgi:hypothetical protein
MNDKRKSRNRFRLGFSTVFLTINSFSMRLLILFVLLSATAALAQDYLVTNKGDTLKGKITLQLNGKIETAVVKGEKRTSISATNTRVVSLEGKIFKPVQFNGNIQFMQVLVDGYLSLYGFQQPNIMAYNGRLLRKRDGKQLEVPSLGFKKHMSSFLSDYEALASKIQEGELGQKDLQDIIKQYNDFISGNSGTPVPVESKAKSTQESTKLDLLKALRSEVEKSGIASRQDALDILTDWQEKMQNGKPVMPYMLKALKSALSTREDLLTKLDEMLLKN